MTAVNFAFPQGPWTTECNQYSWEVHGLHCHINRAHRGFLCGYVFIPKVYSLYGVIGGPELQRLDAHCGIDFADFLETPKRKGWAVGFDCNHFMDLAPADWPDITGYRSYRTFDYVIRETEKLARQIALMQERRG